MRRLTFLLAVLIVFVALAERVWVESALLAEAYRVRTLKRELGAMRHRENELIADIAAQTPQRVLLEKGKEQGIDDLGYGHARLHPRREADDGRSEAP